MLKRKQLSETPSKYGLVKKYNHVGTLRGYWYIQVSPTSKRVRRPPIFFKFMSLQHKHQKSHRRFYFRADISISFNKMETDDPGW